MVVEMIEPFAFVERIPDTIEEIAKADVVPRPLEKKRLEVDAVVAKKFVEVALPETKRLPVVVAPPLIVSPVTCDPPPIVVEPTLFMDRNVVVAVFVDDATVKRILEFIVSPALA